jgi:hypothetical protein
MMNTPISLGVGDILTERPFTHPHHTHNDQAVLQQLAAILYPIADRRRQVEEAQQFHVVRTSDAAGQAHRIILIRPQTLLARRSLTLVGFFGQRRAQADDARLHPLDEVLVQELPGNPDLLSYSSVALPCGNYANLVLFARPEGKQQWSQSQTHAEAVDLAPDFYASVRIYNGRFPQGLHPDAIPHLDTVKYFDYGSQPLWRAVRRLGQ